MKFNIITLVGLLCASFSFSQTSEVLFSVNKTPVTSKEFKRVYNKNIDLVKDKRQKDVDEYLNLYVNYKLKLEEAKALNLDRRSQYLSELNSYRRQLAKKYLTDTNITSKLLDEAYYRTINEVNANHILVRVDENASPADTLKAYNKALEYRKEAIKKGFDKVMKNVHNGKTIYGESLGYFNAFRMVYPFETAAYTTNVGEISMPFRTKFGYHIVNVIENRTSRGEVTIAHIMVASNNETLTNSPKERIEEIYQQLQDGAKFEDLARQFSDDKNSAKNGGKLAKFGSGKLNAKKFEEAAFALAERGEISKPVETKFGWHILKLIKKHPVATKEELKAELERKVRKDSRSKIINDKFYKSLRKRYNFSKVVNAKATIADVVTRAFLQNSSKTRDTVHNEVVATFADQRLTYADYYNDLTSKKRRFRNRTDIANVIDETFDEFVNTTIYRYHDGNLENEFEDFAAILQEYREGLLLFELMEQEIWQKSKTDTTGLAAFYEANKGKYLWKERVDATITTSANKTTAKKVRELLKTNADSDAIKEAVNDVVISEGVFEKEDREIPKKFKFTNGVSKVYKYNQQFVVIKVKEVIAPSQKTFDEVRGKVINDYQEQLELEWLKSLKAKYPVEINDEILNRVKKEL